MKILLIILAGTMLLGSLVCTIAILRRTRKLTELRLEEYEDEVTHQ